MPVVFRYRGYRFFFYSDASAVHVHFDADTMWVDLSDGRQLGVPLAYFPRLLQAKPEERDGFIISGGGSGLHWDELDEDISVKNLLLGIRDQTRRVA
jgi:hypothetical protein